MEGAVGFAHESIRMISTRFRHRRLRKPAEKNDIANGADPAPWNGDVHPIFNQMNWWICDEEMGNRCSLSLDNCIMNDTKRSTIRENHGQVPQLFRTEV
tara:strand:- start:2275 stop:2571 length:297 start_codon:yes stop_codon:yes gene_type:complete